MLSQRIAGLAAQYRLGDTTARDDMVLAIDAFEAAHETLVAASRNSAPDNVAARRLQELYFSPAEALDAHVRGFITDARKIARMAADDPELPGLLTPLFAAARSTLLNQLNQVVVIQQFESERKVATLVRMQWGILATVLLTLLTEAVVIFRPMTRRINSYTTDLLVLATTDPLTRGLNRRAFMERGNAEMARSARYQRDVSLLMIDLDHFKTINDTHGHAAGDAVLRAVGDALRNKLRQTDLWGRVGGEEFAVMLIETDGNGAAVVADRLRRHFASMTVPYGAYDLHFTVSIGVTSLVGADDGLEAAMRAADALLYEAKEAGRNRVVTDRPAVAAV
jgi:diguanylate cyclase (GGDEF)-like protein